ncbi:MAG TPA: asparaginase [Vicinamibacteria bacterium]|nr:asparaginase [Vicinamibacteria bacterium]
MSSRRNVHVLFTGGTISMRIDPGTGAAVPALSGSEIVSRVQGLKKEAQLTLEDYSRLPGPHVTPHWMWRLKDRVARLLADPAVDAVVLTHGTDTLEETAFLLDLTLDSPKPVVFCGAMRTVSEPGWDGPANLMAAVRTAVHPEARERGVLVAVGEAVYAAAEATKWHSQNLAAFRSPLGALAVVDRGRIVFQRPAFRHARIAARRLVSEVDIHTMAAGVDDALLRASLARGARGLVLEATGCGNVPPAALPGIRAALAARVPVVLVSRCAEGRVAPAYGYDGGGQMLHGLGVILGGELPGPKARIKLMVVLGLTSNLAEIRHLMESLPQDSHSASAS